MKMSSITPNLRQLLHASRYNWLAVAVALMLCTGQIRLAHAQAQDDRERTHRDGAGEQTFPDQTVDVTGNK